MSNKPTILVIEDDPALLSGLLDVLVFNGYTVNGISDGEEGLDEILSTPYDLLILDVMLPGIDGYQICKAVRDHKPQQAILMLTAKGAESDIVHGFNMGADDYVCKPFSLNELMLRVKALLRRSGNLCSARKLDIQNVAFDSGSLSMVYASQQLTLTRREMDIIEYLFDHQERIVSRSELLTEVWDYADGDVETRTVDIHMLKLRKKIAELNEDIQLIHTIRGEGYRIDTGGLN